MRDKQMAFDILKGLADSPDGSGHFSPGTVMIIGDKRIGDSEDEAETKRVVRHQVDLLVDRGFAVWKDSKLSIARITNAGYDYLEKLSAEAS